MLLAESTMPGVSTFLRPFLDAIPMLWFVLVALAAVVLGRVAWALVRRRRFANAGMYDIDGMSGRVFEQYLEVTFRHLGYRVERTRFVGDFGGDLVLSKGGVRTAVQAKRSKKAVGIKAVQEVLGAKAYYDCTQAMVVSNNFYTSSASQLARKGNVALWDRNELARQLRSAHAKAVVAANVAPSPPLAQPASNDPLPTVATCASCAKVLTAGERTYCERNARRFGGRMLCFRHQRSAAAPAARS